MTGNELKARRKEMDLTQRDLANRLGVTYQSVQKWEATGDDQARINARHWLSLANALTISIDLLYPVEVPVQAGGDSLVAQGGSSAIKAGRDVSQGQGADFALRPLERQAIELNREVGNDAILKGFIARLLEIKNIASDMY